MDEPIHHGRKEAACGIRTANQRGYIPIIEGSDEVAPFGS